MVGVVLLAQVVPVVLLRWVHPSSPRLSLPVDVVEEDSGQTGKKEVEKKPQRWKPRVDPKLRGQDLASSSTLGR